MVLTLSTLTGLTIPAEAQPQIVQVQLPGGRVISITVDVPPGETIENVELPGTLVAPPGPPQPATAPAAAAPVARKAAEPAPTETVEDAAPEPEAQSGEDAPRVTGGSPQERTSSGVRVERKRPTPRRLARQVDSQPKKGRARGERRPRLRNGDGSPARSNPGFVDVLPGPSSAVGVPNFIIRKFRVPPFLLPIYQAAGIEYGVRWEVLAAINEIETDYGRNLNVSSAGAVGWMQFIPST
ncbi:MAG: hypothetical protein H0U84_09785, partial [Thermoleophilaceae bacterium]|nr:hypothetical protein [Thermoleophilaceae bacterium]